MINTTRNIPILVNGIHRSGSTWAGKMLGLSPSIGAIIEPFKLHRRPRIRRARLDQWFPYVCHANGTLYEKHMRTCPELEYGLTAEFKSVRPLRHIGRASRAFASFTKNRVLAKRA